VLRALKTLDSNSKEANSEEQAQFLNNPEFRVIAIHRNPYQRLIALWSRWYAGRPDSHTLADYCYQVIGQVAADQTDRIAASQPISSLISVQRIDYWLNFEDMEQSWRELSQHLNIPLPALDTSAQHTDQPAARSVLNATLAESIQCHFARDFEHFGYANNSWLSPGSNLPMPTPPPTRATTKPRVAILSTLSKPQHAYSVGRVIQDQVSMLARHGYSPTVIVRGSKQWGEPEGVYSHPLVQFVQLPDVSLNNVRGEEEQFFADIELLKQEFLNILADIDVVITHDLIYVPSSLKISLAARQAGNALSSVRWLHWIHSATPPYQLKSDGIVSELFEDALATPWPNSSAVHFSYKSIPRIAQNFHYAEQDVKVVPNATDIANFFGLGPLASQVYEQMSLFDADFIAVMPVRLDRGKQVDWIIKIMSCLKASNFSVRLIIVDFHSTDTKKSTYREHLKQLAKVWDLTEKELLFTSELTQETEWEAPRSFVRELFCVSNLFIQPSASEGHSLVTQEAALCGNLLVLNADFPPMREIFGEQALYCQFGSGIDRITLLDGNTTLEIEPVHVPQEPSGYPPQLYHREGDEWLIDGSAVHAYSIARRIQQEFTQNKALAQRQHRLRDRNLYSVFRRHLEPLIISQFQA
jgi:glycosyltransferase involved in cell wall biosynthesis